MTYRVAYAQRAIAQLEALYLYVSEATSAATAAKFVGSIMDYCDGFETMPNRGTRRDDIRPDLRIVGFRRRATIAFTVGQDTVAILGVFYRGQEITAALNEIEDAELNEIADARKDEPTISVRLKDL